MMDWPSAATLADPANIGHGRAVAVSGDAEPDPAGGAEMRSEPGAARAGILRISQ
jgi:hypothetical protein